MKLAFALQKKLEFDAVLDYVRLCWEKMHMLFQIYFKRRRKEKQFNLNTEAFVLDSCKRE